MESVWRHFVSFLRSLAKSPYDQGVAGHKDEEGEEEIRSEV
jgi:hypothetical protein